MNYGDVIGRSFRIVFRHPYLWLLGLLAGEAATGFFGSGANRSGSRGTWHYGSGSSAAGWQSFSDWTSVHAGILVAAGVLLAVLAVGLFALQCIAGGAIIGAADAHASDRPYSLGQAWSAGLTTAWRLAGLKLFVLLVWVAAAVITFGTIGITVLLAVSGAWGAAIGTGLLSAVLLPVAIVFWLALGLTTTWALRAAVLEDKPALEALRHGLGLLRHRLGRTLLLWLILALIATVGGVVVFGGVVLVALPFAGLAAVAWTAGAWGPLFVTAAAVGGSVVLVVGAIAAGLLGAYASTYWTLAYRQLDHDAEPAPRAVPSPA